MKTYNMSRLFIGKFKYSVIFILLVASASLLLAGCGQKQPENSVANLAPANSTGDDNIASRRNRNASAEDEDSQTPAKRRRAKTTSEAIVDLNSEMDETVGKLVTYEINYAGRGNPFMPYGEEIEYQNARNSAIKEANAKNAEIIRIKKMKDIAVREPDDISPYSFNLPVPPTAPGGSRQAATITKTKVVGIMYNEKSPSAIINVDNKDYLVRPGDKIIGQEYIVTKINETWVTAAMGPNVYSAAIGELFSKDGVDQNQTDIYDLKNRFGGRKI